MGKENSQSKLKDVTCKFGVNCKLRKSCLYKHDIKPCKFGVNCNLGFNCRYKHDKITCKFGDNCKYGENCRYKHEMKLDKEYGNFNDLLEALQNEISKFEGTVQKLGKQELTNNRSITALKRDLNDDKTKVYGRNRSKRTTKGDMIKFTKFPTSDDRWSVPAHRERLITECDDAIINVL